MSRVGDGLTRSERETIIRIAQDEDRWTVDTSIPSHSRKLDRIAIAIEDLGHSKRYILPRACVTFRKKRIVSQKQRNHLEKSRKKIKGIIPT